MEGEGRERRVRGELTRREEGRSEEEEERKLRRKGMKEKGRFEKVEERAAVKGRGERHVVAY